MMRRSGDEDRDAPKRSGRLSRFLARKNIKLLCMVASAAATVVIAVVTVLQLQRPGVEHPKDLSPSAKSSELLSPSTPPAPGSVPPPGDRVVCLRQSEPVSCQVEHDSESHPGVQRCDASYLMGYLGAHEKIDLISEDLKLKGDGSSCVISGIASETRRPLHGILKNKDGDIYRPCIDTNDRPIGCNAPHAVEIIYRGQEGIDCQLAYEKFVGSKIDPHRDQIKVVPVPKEGLTMECHVRVTVDNQLLRSLRNLKEGALPIESR